MKNLYILVTVPSFLPFFLPPLQLRFNVEIKQSIVKSSPPPTIIFQQNLDSESNVSNKYMNFEKYRSMFQISIELKRAAKETRNTTKKLQ